MQMTTSSSSPSYLIIIPTFFLLFTIIPSAVISQQTPPPPPPAPSPESNNCNGIFITYLYTSGSKLKPTQPKNQPYRFESTLTILNNGAEDLKSWRVFVGFQHSEILVSASNALLADGSSFPASVENGTVFGGYPMADLKTAIETAGDLNQMSVAVKLVGTQFGVNLLTDVPLPNNITLANDAFNCPPATKLGKNQLEVCCTKDETVKTNITTGDEFLPRQKGDLTIMYDITKTFDSSYWAQVTIENHNPLGRLDYWQLSWDWMQEEFINAMKGAYPSVVDSSDCVFGTQGTYYTSLDFSNVLNCERRPTIVDLPLTMTNNTDLGMIKGCCRNGTILPKSMDPSKSSSVFQMQVYKMPPNLNRSELSPPQNFRISGILNPDYKCGPPVRVSPSEFPNPNGLPSNLTSFASWQVVCNITQPKGVSPKCCVSFSAYFNESVVPCKTCACGCNSNTSKTCSTTAQAILLPSEALLVPFENRTALTRAWADLKHLNVPNPMPCGDNCGVSINWHLYTDYKKGWTARITIFNWDETPFADWFTAVQLEHATPGFQKAYSFNATTLNTLDSGENNTIFMQGLEGLNYLVAETDSANPQKDPRVPGKQQSVISFTKKLTPGINVAAGDGFPTKLFFNGEECSLPSVLPTSGGNRKDLTKLLSVMLVVFVSVLLL